MENLDASVSFTPYLVERLPGARVVVVKQALRGDPIRSWVRDWTPSRERDPGDRDRRGIGESYAAMIDAMHRQLHGERPDTVTFVWMQGEREGRDRDGRNYARNLRRLFQQLSEDLERDDVTFVIGRLSDYEDPEYPDFERVRAAQVEVADELGDRARWIDTDDLNGMEDRLHYTRRGTRLLGQRFAEAAFSLLPRPD